MTTIKSSWPRALAAWATAARIPPLRKKVALRQESRARGETAAEAAQPGKAKA